MRQFNAKGWNEVFRNGALLLARKPGIKGIFGGAWFFDPNLLVISPEFGYLQDMIYTIGGQTFFAGRKEQDKKNAFAMSAVRKRAFEEGKYTPTGYIAIIPRSSLLRYYEIKNVS